MRIRFPSPAPGNFHLGRQSCVTFPSYRFWAARSAWRRPDAAPPERCPPRSIKGRILYLIYLHIFSHFRPLPRRGWVSADVSMVMVLKYAAELSAVLAFLAILPGACASWVKPYRKRGGRCGYRGRHSKRRRRRCAHGEVARRRCRRSARGALGRSWRMAVVSVSASGTWARWAGVVR
jgi:hypothetical protein